jgi:hypothetical protein
MITRRVSCRLIAMSLVLMLPATGLAQSGSAIAGVVKDATGAILPGVTVEASSPSLIEKIRTVVTDAAGQYKIINLVPGAYTVTFALPGFSTVKRDGIELTASFTATVNADLRVGAVEETITVSAAAPTVDIQNVVQQRVMTRDVIDAVPTGQKSVSAIGALIPGVTASNQDVGGTAFTSGQLAIHGSRAGEMQLMYDGMYYNNGQGRGGIFAGISTIDGTVQEMSLETAGLSAESELGGIRTNIIPKDGGNTFKGSLFGAFTNDRFQSDNLTDGLKARGLTAAPVVKKIYDVNPSVGGPLKKDTLWFFSSYRNWSSQSTVAGIFYSVDPRSPVYTPDLSRPALNIEKNEAASLRLTWQATSKNKFSAQYQPGVKHRPFYGYSLNALTTTPEATQANRSLPDYLAQAGWTSPVTSRLLLESGVAFMNLDYVVFPQPGVSPDAPSFRDLGTGITWGNYGGGSSTLFGHNASHQLNARLAASYVTGSHAAKVGVTFMRSSSYVTSDLNPTETTLQVLNGLPRQVTVFAIPLTYEEVMKANVGVFGQDQWTIKRLTVNLGLRFDYLNSYVPAQHIGPSPQTPLRNVDFAAVENVPNWKNVSPRMGASFDLFGDGKTAVKVSLGRYLEGPNLVSFTRAANPAAAIVTSATRTWNDSNSDLVPQPGELGPLNPSNFGNSNVTTRYADKVLTTRGFNWETSASVQHELLPRVSANVGYFRRWYGNFRATDNLNATPADYSPYCVTAPPDSRLPGGGGYQLCGLFDGNRIFATNNVITLAKDFGDQSEIYNGVDVSINARLPRGVVFSGGTSTGRVATNNCFVIDSPQALLNCDVRPPFLTQIKLIGVYPLPWGLQTAATFQSVPGPQITAAYAAPNAQIAPTLGRNLASCGTAVICNGTATIPLVAPGTMYEDRLHQLDFRLSRLFKFGAGGRLQANVDLYNAFNGSAVLALNNTFGPLWQRPTTILQGRLVRFSAQVDF